MVRASLSDKVADQILSVTKRMDEADAECFFAWLGQYLYENNFNSVDSPPEVRMRKWLRNSDTAAVLMLEYLVIMSEAERIGASK